MVVIFYNVNLARLDPTVWCFPCLVIVIYARKVFPSHSSSTRDFLAFMTMNSQGKHHTVRTSSQDCYIPSFFFQIWPQCVNYINNVHFFAVKAVGKVANKCQKYQILSKNMSKWPKFSKNCPKQLKICTCPTTIPSVFLRFDHSV